VCVCVCVVTCDPTSPPWCSTGDDGAEEQAAGGGGEGGGGGGGGRGGEGREGLAAACLPEPVSDRAPS